MTKKQYEGCVKWSWGDEKIKRHHIQYVFQETQLGTSGENTFSSMCKEKTALKKEPEHNQGSGISWQPCQLVALKQHIPIASAKP